MKQTLSILNQKESRSLLANVRDQHAGLRNAADTAAVYKALGDPVRLEILGMLVERRCCKCELVDALDGAASTITHHLSILEKAGLIASSKDGKYTLFHLHADKEKVKQWLRGWM
ncbi:ArsR/SmtB family transcription factor [Salisediminibacterium beveridgei]|uniref:Transcriptional regulator, ArsR family n=1 Tax=Salisediminibacterium beveridgei TaxID=632773 RepID=A0A1D7QWT2_9BACI|nr:metalloregulator ArsR/SmtB family transcription factor [Salisediminibacterium beveridgei]AOM83475.1 transcriptional regulator, ArsR family [Salisediminibacterium beveridgei]